MKCFFRSYVLSAILTAAWIVPAFVGAAGAQEAAVRPVVLEIREEGERFKAKGADVQFPRSIVVETPAGEMFTLKALGSGLRKKFVFKVYEAAVYADEEAVLGPDLYRALVEGGFAKRVVMHFLRDVDGGKIRDAWEDGFRKAARSQPGRNLEKSEAEFLSFFGDEGVKEGERIELTWLPALGLCTAVAGNPMPVIDDEGLAGALFSIWLGDDPISTDLKKDMVRLVGSQNE